jgi:hypothetical protein
MSAETDPLLALDVSTDDYAITAAHDQKAGTDATLAAVEAEDRKRKGRSCTCCTNEIYRRRFSCTKG